MAQRTKTASYIAELLFEMEGLAKQDNIYELEQYLRHAREVAQKLAGED